MKNFRYFTFVMMVTLAFPYAIFAQEVLFEVSDKMEVKKKERVQGLESRFHIKFNTDVLAPGESRELALPLPLGKVIVKLRPVSPESIGLKRKQSAWTGPIFAEQRSGRKASVGEVFLMQIGEYVQARIVIKDQVYSLRVLKGGRGILEQFKGNLLRDHPEGVKPPVEPPSPKIGKDQPDSSCNDTADRIDIMVVYTEAAREAASTDLGVSTASSTAIENEIAFALGEANMALNNSAAFHRYNLVRIDEVTYDELTDGGASTTLLSELGNTSDMVMDEVHGWRDASKADLVSLVTADGDCGWGNSVQTANADTTDHRGFTVVRRSCLNTNISLAHELGHNLGGLHNIENSSTASSLTPPFNHGHFETSPTDSAVTPWRTVMSYNSDDCENDTPGGFCARRTQFSDPDINFPTVGGDPTGVVDAKDNVRVFAQNDSQVAKYRCSKTDVEEANVWGKDTWADTGLEPDPATASESMWRSPYIWVRNSQDVNDEHQHEHENPNISADPHVYVKLHNDGNLSESADLELYVADASTNLNSPSNWNLIDTQSPTITTGVRVVEFPWGSLPGTGHFCLLARWNNDGTTLSFSSIDAAVRGDKGTIWRNVNIVDMSADSGDEQVLQVRGTELSKKTFLQVETRPFTQRKFPWQKVMKATLRIDQKILGKGLESEGLKQIAPGQFVVPLNADRKIVGPLLLKPEQIAKVTLQVDVDKKSLEYLKRKFGVNQHFSISIQQVLPEALKLQDSNKRQPFPAKLILGGVNYTVGMPRN